jgi:zinc/manganese transport system substrate-binding protein
MLISMLLLPLWRSAPSFSLRFRRWLVPLGLALSALFGFAAPAHAELTIVASTPDLANVAAAVGKGRVHVTALALATQDPHWVDARPNLVLELSHADLLVSVGAELEVGWLPTLQVGSRNGKIQRGSPGFLECSSLVELLERPEGKVDRSMGDIHPGGNPHYMLDPRQVERVAVGVGKRLAELDPDGRAAYLQNTKEFVTALREARARWEKQLAPVRGKEVVTFHKSLSYLADWLGLVVADNVEPKPGIPPNPHHVAEIIGHAKQHPFKAILQESWYPSSTSELIAKEAGATLVRLPGASDFQNGQSYIAFMDKLVSLLAGGL